VIRLSGVFAVFLALLSGALLFWASQAVQRAEDNLYELSLKVSGEEESLRVLSAEWDYLNRPERLEKLVSENFDIDGDLVKGANIIDATDRIPEPVVPAVPRRKPNNILQYVSAYKKERRRERRDHQEPVIQNGENDRFDQLIHDTSEGVSQ
jgi:hypothetical protein